MKNVTALALLLGFVGLPAVAAQDAAFQHEAGLSYNANSEEFGDGIWNAKYRYYVSPVDQANGPYALNGFLAQKSNVGANYSIFDAADVDTLGFDGTYVFDSKWFVGGQFQRVEFGNNSGSVYKLDGGYFFNDSSKVAAFYIDGSDDFESQFGAEVRSFIDFETTTGIDLGASWTHTDADDLININADWYVTKAWSVGLGYADVGSDDAFMVKTAYWLRMSDAFSATFDLSKDLDSDADGYNVGVGVVGRF
ncbi:putative porin [Shewanella sp. HL-SH4]|uniref:putative porin n=1 Tax=Shewanella sp. HL-SH4 TaxID=3436240 RepID=UPI003EB6B59C